MVMRSLPLFFMPIYFMPKMIHYCPITNKYQFSTPNRSVDNCSKKPLIYNQLFLNDQLFVLNIITGEIYTNTIDPDMVNNLKQHNFCVDNAGRFLTKLNGETVYIYELIYSVKTNANCVINHIDGDPSNNKRSNLELVTKWFNSALRKKQSGLPIGVTYNNGGTTYLTQIRMPRVNGKAIGFGAKSVDYLQNLHYQFSTKSGLVSPDRYLAEVPNWLPNNIIQFTTDHQIKLDELITAHLENQATWENPTFLK
jgi:hypothetical protein